MELRKQVDRLLAGHRKEMDLVRQGEAALKPVFPTLDHPEAAAGHATQIGPYKLREQIGEGGFGVVYRAEDTDLRRPVALKLLSTDGLDREDTRARFMREARTAAALNHPNICTIYEVGEADRQP